MAADRDRHHQGAQGDLLQIDKDRHDQCRRRMGGFTRCGRPRHHNFAKSGRSRRFLSENHRGDGRRPSFAEKRRVTYAPARAAAAVKAAAIRGSTPGRTFRRYTARAGKPNAGRGHGDRSPFRRKVAVFRREFEVLYSRNKMRAPCPDYLIGASSR